MNNNQKAESKKCLLTGGTGDIGRQVAARLIIAGCRVTVFARPESDTAGLKKLGADIFAGDLKDTKSLKNAIPGQNFVFHLGEVGLSDPDFLEGNMAALKCALKSCAASPAFERLVFMSSQAVACFPAQSPAGEESPATNLMNDRHTAYKRRAEALLKGCGLPVSILRPCHVYGPGVYYLKNFFNFAARFGNLGIPFPGRRDILLPFIHISDLCEATVRSAFLKDPGPKVYNAVDDTPFPRDRFVRMVAEGLGKPVKLISPPPALQRAAFRIMDAALGSRPYSNVASWGEYYLRDHVFSNRRMKDDLGLKLAYPSVPDGIGSFIRWMRLKDKKLR